MNVQRGARRRASRFLALLALPLAACADSALAESYLILPLIGDRLTIVAPDQQTGSRIDRNQYRVLPQSSPALDNVALLAAEESIRKARPLASIEFLRASDPKLYALRDSWLDTDAVDTRALLALVAQQATSAADAYLLLIMPYRAGLELKTQSDYRGTGKVAGLGFYVDRATPMHRSDTKESGFGFLGVFANVQLVLIGLQTGAVVARERATLGTTIAAAYAPDGHPWNALTAAQKDAELKSMLNEAIARELPKMLAPRRP